MLLKFYDPGLFKYVVFYRMCLAKEPMFKQLRNISTNNRCAVLNGQVDNSSGADSSDEGDVVNPPPPPPSTHMLKV